MRESLKTEVFISFKNTDFSGNLTEDSKIAQDLYEVLKDRNIPTFFSGRTLMDLGQAVYKRAIDEALENTKVLIVVSTRPEFLNSEWVKYEWEGFHQDILSGTKRGAQIVPVFSNMAREEIPRSLRNFQTFHIGSNTLEEVADFVEKTLNAINAEREKAKEFTGDEKFVAKKAVATKKIRQSLYTSDSNREFERLQVQSKNTNACDNAVLDKIFDKIDKETIWVLDLGCAYNFVGKMRFGHRPNVKVLGIDISEKCLNYAKEHTEGDKFTFRYLDLEDPFFEDNMYEIMDELGIEKFDVAFGALLLLHLKKPITVLKKLRKFISDDGYIMIRGSDDGSVIAVNDDGLIKKIVDKCNTTVGFSDRQNGRKLYNQLASAGYKDVKVETFIKDLSGKDAEERDEIFFERFSYRINNFKKILDADPTNEIKRNDYLFMKYALDELEEMFNNLDFWYCEHDFIAYAKVKI